MWTRFMDMHSGGDTTEPPYNKILIEADKATARVVFYNRFGHNPDRVTCTCCGPDYSIDEWPTLAEATACDRNCQPIKGPDRSWRYLEHGEPMPEGWSASYAHSGPALTLDEYLTRPDVLVIREADILPEQRTEEVPVQGFVWAD